MAKFTVLVKNLFMTNYRCWFQIWQYFSFKITPKQAFLVLKLKNFNIARNFAFLQIRRWQWFFKLRKKKKISNMTIVFQTNSPEYPNKAILVAKWILLFCFAQFFAFHQILGCSFQVSQSLFPIFNLKIPKGHFRSQT